MPDDRNPLKRQITQRLAWLSDAMDPKRKGNGSASQAALRAFQAQRLEASFADVLADPEMHAAARFFLSDLYADRDFSARDRDIDRIMPVMVHLLPESLLRAARDAIELHVLSHVLDLRVARAMDAMRIRRLDAERYGEAYRAAGLPLLRQRQIKQVLSVGHSLDAAVQRHGVRRILRASRFPARAAGLSELQGFLERGFDAFAKLDGADPFLKRIARGEAEISRRLFAGHPEPFDGGAPVR